MKYVSADLYFFIASATLQIQIGRKLFEILLKYYILYYISSWLTLDKKWAKYPYEIKHLILDKIIELVAHFYGILHE